mgnify:CR=1 FL=1
MKIGKITLDGYFNYGNVLQNYALRHILLQYADTVDSIWHSQENFIVYTWYKWSWKEPIKWLLNYRGFRNQLFCDHYGMEMVRQGRIKEWCDRYIGIKRVDDLSKITTAYDYFVVGSDQVWNPYFSDLDHCFLTFTPKEKRIAYAASISSPDIPENVKQMFKQGLTEMAHISMREQAGADMVKSFSGRDVPVVVDPTLLLTADEWRKVSRQPAWYHGENYILTYFLGKRPEVVDKLSNETGLPVVNILDKDVYEHYVTSPDEFLWAIEHAKLLYTDSFHGTVFSILFRTPFVVCNRIGSAVEEKMGSRIDTLLGFFGLEARRGTKNNGYAIDNPLAAPDWSQVDDVLARERKRSDEYLRQAFGMA